MHDLDNDMLGDIWHSLSHHLHPDNVIHHHTLHTVKHNISFLYNGAFQDKCMECPYGGLCTGNNVIPRPNYWGYWHENKLVFQQCPADYCCSGGDESPCSSYDHCEKNRTGILCGSCEENFSVSLITGVCTPNSQCGGDQWFWSFAIFSALMYAMWYTFKDVIFGSIFTLLACVEDMCSRLKSRRKSDVMKLDKQSIQHVQEGGNQNNGEDSANKGYFGIVTYYVQMAAVIRIQIEFSDIDKSDPLLDKIGDNIGESLNVDVTKMPFDACPIIGLSTLGKLLYLLCFLFGIYICWMGMFILVVVLVKVFKRRVTMTSFIRLQSLKVTLVGGIVEIIKYTYAGFCGIIFMSLVCAKIGSHYVWWYDASHTCLENWQVMIVIFALVYAIPFPFILIFGLKLLTERKMSAAQFICCCSCPLLALLLIAIYHFQKKNTTISDTSESCSLPNASEAIISILQGPYRDDEKNLTLYWEAMISIRRLLITSMTLVPYASIRMSIISVLSLLFLIQHIYMSPFQVHTSNNAETVSLALLCVTSVINLLKATLTDSGVVPTGPSVPFFKSLEFCEKMFVFFIIGYILMIELKLWDKKENGKSDKK